MWVTCYTDASYSPDRGGGWAVWLRCQEGRLVRHGACPSYVRGSHAAELAAIFAGVHLALSTWGSRVRGICVRSDCRGALAQADPEAQRSRKEAIRRLQQKIAALVEQHRVELDLRWVPAHRDPSASISAYLNTRCDRLANEARRSQPRPSQPKRRRRRRRR